MSRPSGRNSSRLTAVLLAAAALSGCGAQGPEGTYVGEEPSVPTGASAPSPAHFAVRFHGDTATVDVELLAQTGVFVYTVRVDGDQVLLLSDRGGAPRWTFAVRNPRTLECLACPAGAPRLWQHK